LLNLIIHILIIPFPTNRLNGSQLLFQGYTFGLCKNLLHRRKGVRRNPPVEYAQDCHHYEEPLLQVPACNNWLWEWFYDHLRTCKWFQPCHTKYKQHVLQRYLSRYVPWCLANFILKIPILFYICLCRNFDSKSPALIFRKSI
jgi:hypothetical protein